MPGNAPPWRLSHGGTIRLASVTVTVTSRYPLFTYPLIRTDVHPQHPPPWFHRLMNDIEIGGRDRAVDRMVRIEPAVELEPHVAVVHVDAGGLGDEVVHERRPGSDGSWVTSGTPSIALGRGMPCQWIVVGSGRWFSRTTRHESSSRS